MEIVLLFLAAIPLAAAGMLILVHRSSNFRKLFRWLIVAGVVCGIIAAFLLNLPAGGTIVMFNIAFLLLVFGARKILPLQR